MNAVLAKIKADHRQAIVDALRTLEGDDSARGLIEEAAVALEEDIVLYRSMGVEKKGEK